MLELAGVASNAAISLEVKPPQLMLEVVLMMSEPEWSHDADHQMIKRRPTTFKTMRFATTTHALRQVLDRLQEHIEHAEDAYEKMQERLALGRAKSDDTSGAAANE